MSTLAVVIPVYNQARELPATLDALDAAIGRSDFDARILVVDDGSTDGTADAARGWAGRTRVELLAQANAGRFAARRRGVDAASADLCLLIDSRVAIGEDALLFVQSRLDDPARRVWNAHVEIETEGNPFGVFWDVLTRRAFSAYFADPRTTSFGVEDFERFPKGTTCFLAPRTLLAEAFDAFRTVYADARNANDDTPVIRWIAARTPINISPGFSCRYASRNRLRPFFRHALHRGVVFVDGHGRRESRFLPFVLAFYPLTVVWIVACVWVPPLVVVPFVLAALAGLALGLADDRPRAALTMAWVTPVYVTAHALGMWRGLGHVLRARFGGGR